MIVKRFRHFALLSVLLPGLHAMAAGSPATFEHPEDALLPRIKFPELRGDATGRILCTSYVERSGKIDKTGCFLNQPSDQVFVKAVVEGARKARMTPASVNGRPFAVYVQYIVEFSKKGDDEIIIIHNHPGVTENVEVYGVDHIGAQRGQTKEPWMNECPKRVRFAVWARAHVAETGEPSSISLTRAEGAAITERCEDAIIETLQQSTFVPAYADGEPVPSTYVEPFGN